MKKNSLIIGSALLLSLAVALPTFAQDGRGQGERGRGMGRGLGQEIGEDRGLGAGRVEAEGGSENGRYGGVGQMGLPATITGVSGTTLTVASRGLTFTVNVSSATIARELLPATVTPGTRPVAQVISLADLKVGDGITVMGPVTGTTINATRIVIRPAGAPLGNGMMGRGQGRGQRFEDATLAGNRPAVVPNASAQAKSKASFMSRLWQPFKNFFGWFGKK